MFKLKYQLIIFVLLIPFTISKCDDYSKAFLFIGDYAIWRKINFISLVGDDINSVYNIKAIVENSNVFFTRNIYFTVQTSLKFSEFVLEQIDQKVMVVTFLRVNFSTQELIDQANEIINYGEKISWLILAACHLQIMNVLRFVNFGLNADIVIALDARVNLGKNEEGNYTDTFFGNPQDEEFLPFKDRKGQTTNFDSFMECIQHSQTADQELNYSLYQIYKIRKNDNTSLVVRSLGIWNSISSIKNLKQFWYIEKRTNFHEYPILVGYSNTNKEGIVKKEDLDERKTYFMDYFSKLLNFTERSIGYAKLGHRENDDWTDLLDGICHGHIDISAEGVSKTTDIIRDMSFSLDILKNKRNFYVQPKKSQILRNIFLVPFASNLVLCVIGTGIILSIAMVINNFVNAKLVFSDIRRRNKNISESVIWCIGVFSQQGSILKARSYSEKILVLIALLFTLVIFNSYSAFITSVLSVELNSIKNVHDLLQSDYTVGYTRESVDEEYLRSVNVSELKQIYLRGYLQNDITNISNGLKKATEGNFAFFASAYLARMEFWNMTKFKCKYDLDEITIENTVEYMAFIVPKKSNFIHVINQSIIKMFETGVYKYIYSLIYPQLLKCKKPQTFESARLVDLSAAFFIIFFGWIASLVILILECVLMRRSRLIRNFERKISTINTNMNNYYNTADWHYARNFHYNNYRRNKLILPHGKNAKHFDFVN